MSLFCEYRRARATFLLLKTIKEVGRRGGQNGDEALTIRRHTVVKWPCAAPGKYFMTSNIFFYFGPKCCAGIEQGKGMTYACGDLVWSSLQAAANHRLPLWWHADGSSLNFMEMSEWKSITNVSPAQNWTSSSFMVDHNFPKRHLLNFMVWRSCDCDRKWPSKMLVFPKYKLVFFKDQS